MVFIDKKMLVTSDGQVLISNINEVILSSDRIFPQYSNDGFRNAVMDPIITDIYKIILLYPDEREKQDISSYIIDDTISYSNEYKSGQCRSVNFTLRNDNGAWNPSPVSGGIWSGTKVKVYAGILFEDTVYWIPKGVFVMKNPSYDEDERTVSLQFADKFAALDGTLGGRLEVDYKIPPNTPIFEAISTLLTLDSGNGEVFDHRPVIFPSAHAADRTPYTMEVTNSSSVGDIILELAEIISCDVFYNEHGYLTLQPADDLLEVANKPVLWRFDKDGLSRISTSYDVDFENVVNKVCVVGANINGAISSYTATNINAKSPSNIYMTRINFEYISDSNIGTDALCQIRAEYELQKKSVVSMSHKFECLYMPFVEANSIVLYTNPEIGAYNQKLFVTSVSESGGTTSLSCTNVEDLPF